jgi:hypothetical protein
MVLKSWSCFSFFFLIFGTALAFGTNTWNWFCGTGKYGAAVYLRLTVTGK